MPPKTRFLHMIIYKMVFVCPLKLNFCMEYNSYSPKKSVFSHVFPQKLDFCMEYNSYSPKKLVFSHVFPQKLDFNTHQMQYVWPLSRMLNHVGNRLNTGGKPSTHLSMKPKSSRIHFAKENTYCCNETKLSSLVIV